MKVIIDKSNPNYKSDLKYMMLFLLSTERYLDSILRSAGYLSLDYALDFLGIKHEPYWVLGWEMKVDQGDKFVSLGISDLYRKFNRSCYVKAHTRRLNDGRIINVKAHYRGLRETPEQIELDLNVPHYAHLPIDHLF